MGYSCSNGLKGALEEKISSTRKEAKLLRSKRSICCSVFVHVQSGHQATDSRNSKSISRFERYSACLARPVSTMQKTRNRRSILCRAKSKASHSGPVRLSCSWALSFVFYSSSLFSFAVMKNLLRLLGQTSLCAIGEITLGEPLTGLDDLDNIDPLLEQHDGG